MGSRRLASPGRIVEFVSFLAICIVPLAQLQADVRDGFDAPATLDLANLQTQFRKIADQVSTSVVAISVASIDSNSDNLIRPAALNGQKLETLLERTTRIVGTGFVIDAGGYILTNEHVVGESSQIWITTDDRRVFPAMIVGSDPRLDLAVLKVPATDLHPVKLACEPARRGDWTIAIGNPFGLASVGEMSMSVGIVSAVDRALPKLAQQENRVYANLIQTTAEINPGNSGGPLFNLDGEVIGVNTAVIMPQKCTNGIGFAMPITPALLSRVQDLKAGKEIIYAYLGVSVSDLSIEQRRDAHLPVGGASVDAIEKDSPAESLFNPGDIVTAMNGLPIAASEKFIAAVGESSISQPMRFTVCRDGKILSFDVLLKRRQLPAVAIDQSNQRIRWRGMLLGPIPANWPMNNKPDHGLLVLGIDPTSPLIKLGIHSGTVISAIAGRPLREVSDVTDIVNQTPVAQCSVDVLPPTKQLAAR